MKLDDRIRAMSGLVAGLKYYEWSRIRAAIDKKFSSASNRVELSDAEEIERLLPFLRSFSHLPFKVTLDNNPKTI